jgi:hypothetical protein
MVTVPAATEGLALPPADAGGMAAAVLLEAALEGAAPAGSDALLVSTKSDMVCIRLLACLFVVFACCV